MITGTTDARAREAWRVRFDGAWRSLVRPPPRLGMSEWADQFRMLSPEASAEPGPWRTDRVPYLRGIMDTISDPMVRRVTIMAASQVAKTELLNNALGYFIHVDPGPILVVQYSVEMAHAWSKDRFAPMIRDTPVLRARVGDPRSRDSGNTILHKTFPGGHITAIGANAPAGLSARPIRIVLFDEVDRYPASAGTEGDPMRLGMQRTRAFWNRKIIDASSPGVHGVSRIEKSYELSDQRRYFVPCPHCEHMQVLLGDTEEKWTERFIWETEVVDGELVHHPETTAYRCQRCACLIDQREKYEMMRRGEWRPTNPAGAYPGFHLPAVYSPFVSWAELASEFLEVKDDAEQLKTFVNLQLAETWKERREDITPDMLSSRAEQWPADVPNGVGVLTAGVDVQDDRIEIAIKGWGAGEESWLIGHHRVYGDPQDIETWRRVDYHLGREYQHQSGAVMHVQATCVDSGHMKTEVYEFVKPREGRGVYAIKGVDTRSSEPLKRSQRANRQGVKLWTVGTYSFKDVIFRRLQLEQPGIAGYMHFCAPTPAMSPEGSAISSGGADREYFEQFGAEIRVREKSGGRFILRYKQIRRRNEAIDLEVYSIAALHILGPAVRERLAEMADALREGKSPVARRRRGRRVRHHGVKA